MPQIDDVKGGGLRAARRQTRESSTATPLSSSSIGRGGLRVHSGGVITIQNGGLSVTGTAEVIGELIGSGALTWTGPTNLEGPVVIDGETTINGDTSITGVTTISGPLNIIGPVDITDDLDMTGDMTVSGGGKINVGNMKIGEGTHGDGKGVSFTNGGALSATGNRVEIYAASNGLITAGTSESAIYLGANGVIVNSSGVKLSGLTLDASKAPNVHIDGTGRLWRTS